jgi:mono/diheme cytochrome c family protein
MAAGHALSFNTRQLTHAFAMDGFAGNQIDLLRDGGFFANVPDSTNLLPRHVRPDETAFSVEQRARSYLAVNCANCHQPGAGAPPTWDGRAELTLAQTHLVNGFANNNGGTGDYRLIIPGDTAHSIVFNRATAAAGFTRMPPIATSEIDPEGSALLAEWISSALPARQTYDQWRLLWFGSSDLPEGDPDSDPDGDGHTNADEFMAGTNPTDTFAPALPALSMTDDTITLGFDVPANRAFQIEVSSDLVEWSLWDVPGNDGLLRADSSLSLSGPIAGPQQFFRLRFSEP